MKNSGEQIVEKFSNYTKICLDKNLEIVDIQENINKIRTIGHSIINTFVLQKNIGGLIVIFIYKYVYKSANTDPKDIIDETLLEIEIFQKYHEYYRYVFYNS